MLATTPLFSLLFLLLIYHHPTTATTTEDSPYLTKTLFSDYQKMLFTFKIFIYPNHNPNLTQTFPPPLSLFYSSLLTSAYVTHDPNEATMFLLPFHNQSTRSLARVIQTTRTSSPFWDRSLGADHFYLACNEMGPASSRNVVELRKNAVQVSCFPSPAREFIPHKDVTLPPSFSYPRAEIVEVGSTRYLGYIVNDQVRSSAGLISEARNDPDFLVKSELSDDVESMKKSKFCLFSYDVDGLRRLGKALVQGCVCVVITDRPIQDFPLMDVIKWSEIALFVGSNVGVEKLKSLLNATCEEVEKYERMRRLGVAAARHLVWNDEPEPYDAFNMVMYQLWLKRHAVRYARWEVV